MLTTLIVYAFLGAIAGLLAGLLGVGGGIVIVPMLVFTFGWQNFSPDVLIHLALGTSMASIIFTSISSARAHSKRGYVDWKIVWAITPGILLGTYGGSFVAAHLPARALQFVFVAFLLYVASQMISGKKPKPSRHLPGAAGMTAVGGGIGLVSSLVGIGGGTLSVPFMLWSNVPAHSAIGTSAAIGFPIAVAGGLGYLTNGLGVANLPAYSWGYIYLPALFGIVIVSMFTAPIGARIAHKLPVDKLKRYFACLLFLVALRMFIMAM